MQGGEHRPRRIPRGERPVVAAASGRLQRRVTKRAHPSASPRAQQITARHASSRASSAGSLPSSVIAAHTSSASSSRPRRYNRPARLRARAVVGTPCAHSPRGTGAVPHPTILLGKREVARQLRELVVRSPLFGNGKGSLDGIRCREPVRMLDGEKHVAGPLRITESVLRTCSASPARRRQKAGIVDRLR